MIPTPAHYLDGVRATHAPRWHLTLSNGLDLSPLAVKGSISKTAGRSPRCRVTISTATPGVPLLLNQGLLPTGATLNVDWSMHPYTERIRVASVVLVRSPLTRPESTWALEFVDPSGPIAVDHLDPLLWAQLTPPTTIAGLITTIVRRTWPDATVAVTGPALTMPVPAELKIDGDPWAVAEDAAAAAGSELWWRPDGVCVVRPTPSIAANAVDVIRTGPGGTITGYELDHERGYSAVYLQYNNADGTVGRIGRWYDTRPASPTATARIGRAVYRQTITTGLIPSQVDADTAAAATAVRAAGRSRRATVRHVPHPWLEPGDTVLVGFAGGPDELHLVDAVDIPIGPGVQTTTLRNHSYEVRT